MAQMNRTEGYPSLTAREHWGKYAAGVVTEVVFILGLTLMGYLLALVAMVIWR
ncbi:MAG TPA: hypothetical protein VLA05_10590 [Coriobacteriia bacterium]|nr:hypothetical protein [Coriobacteriia bacterium]